MSVRYMRAEQLGEAAGVGSRGNKGQQGIDILVLVTADVSPYDCYNICTGAGDQKEIWLKKRPGLGRLEPGWMYRLVSPKATWSRVYRGTKVCWELDLGEDGRAEPCACLQKSVYPGLQVEHEEFGTGQLTVFSNGCRGLALFSTDRPGEVKQLDLGFCFDRLYLRRVDPSTNLSGSRNHDHQC